MEDLKRHSELFGEVLDKLLLLGSFVLIFIHKHLLKVLGELQRPMNLNLLISSNHARGHLLAVSSPHRGFELGIAQPVQNVVAELEGADEGVGVAGVLVGDGAALTDLLLEEQVGVAVGAAGVDTLGVIREVYCAVFYFEGFIGFVVLLEEHARLPAGPAGQVGASRALSCLELVAIVGILDEELHVF
jgi:hypothetical protein